MPLVRRWGEAGWDGMGKGCRGAGRRWRANLGLLGNETAENACKPNARVHPCFKIVHT